MKKVTNKSKKNNVKNKITIAALSLIIVPFSVYTIHDNFSNNEDEIAVVDNSVSYEVDNFEDLKTSFYNGSISASQMQASLNEFLDYSPTFETETESSVDEVIKTEAEPEETAEKELDSEKVYELMTAYLDGLFIKQNRLNKMAPLLKDELHMIEELTGDKFKNDIQVVENLDSPLIDGFMEELHNTPLYLNSEDGNFTVWVGYGEIGKKYEDYLSEFHTDLIKLHRDVIRFGYTRMDGEIDASAIYNRLLLIDEIQDGDVTKDDFYWENERYQLAVLFTGYGDEELPSWDEKRLKQMEDIAKINTEPNRYNEIAVKLLESIEEEEKYGEETLRVANQWMHDEFQDYSKHIEKIAKENN